MATRAQGTEIPEVPRLTEDEIREEIRRWGEESKSLNMTVVGITGVGKSSLINSVVGKNIAEEGWKSGSITSMVTSYKENICGIEVTLWDTPGLQGVLGVDTEDAVWMIGEKCTDIDLLVFCSDMTDRRLTRDTRDTISEITHVFGHGVWEHAIVALTCANEVKPPEGSNDTVVGFFKEKLVYIQTALRKVMIEQIGIPKTMVDELPIVPTGYRERALPDRPDWFTLFWMACYYKTKNKAKPALLIINNHRFTSAENAQKKDEEKMEPYKRPIVGDRYKGVEEIAELTGAGSVQKWGSIIARALRQRLGFTSKGPVPATQATGEATTTTKEIQEQLAPPEKRDQSVQTYTEPPFLQRLKGYLRGVEIVNQTSLTYSGKAYSFHWEKHGLAISFPENALPPGTRDCHITITASISGQYQFPNDSELVSGVYWIACPVKFTQPVTLEIQHCSSQTDEDQLSFVTAKCTQEDLPYSFRVLDGGVFPLTTSYGSIQLTGFSGLAIIRRLIRRIHPRVVPKRYCGLLYYSPLYNVTASVKRWKAYFVISLNLNIHFTAIDKDYSGFAKRTGPPLEVQFRDTDETITLNLHTERIEVREWTVIPAIFPPTITKEQVDSYKPGTTAQPASCTVFMDWKSREEPIGILHKVELEGVQGQHNAFMLELPPGIQQLPLSPNQPALSPLVPLEATNAVGICDVLKTSGFHLSSWQDLATRLRISDPESFASQKLSDSLRLQGTIRQWLENDLEASWEKLADEVSRIEGYGLRTMQNILNNAGAATTQ